MPQHLTEVVELLVEGFLYVHTSSRVGVMLNVMVMHCNALHVFKVMLVMCNATKLALQVMVM